MEYGYEIKTTPSIDGIIKQEINLKLNDSIQKIFEMSINTRERQVEEALIKLGWTSPEVGAINFRSRGIGLDSGKCFKSGCEETGVLHNIAAFVDSEGDGRKVVRMFEQGAYLDYRKTEPDWIQVKIHACGEHLSALEELNNASLVSNEITLELVKRFK